MAGLYHFGAHARHQLCWGSQGAGGRPVQTLWGPNGSCTLGLRAGRGRQVIAVCKSADLLLMVLDASKPDFHKDILTRELESVGIRLNRWRRRTVFQLLSHKAWCCPGCCQDNAARPAWPSTSSWGGSLQEPTRQDGCSGLSRG